MLNIRWYLSKFSNRNRWNKYLEAKPLLLFFGGYMGFAVTLSLPQLTHLLGHSLNPEDL